LASKSGTAPHTPKSNPLAGVRFGLCCAFSDAPIKFRTTTALALQRLPRAGQLAKLSEIALDNCAALLEALRTCHALGIGAFRVLSTPFPRATHPEVGYALDDLPGADQVFAQLRAAAEFAREHALRLSFHPDQFVVLSSPRAEVVDKSIAELEHHAEIAALLHADVINIHGGGAYGDKASALDTFARSFSRLSDACRARLTVENDDVTYTVADLQSLCRMLGTPLIYDVHHHRCLPDGLSVAEATEACFETWKAAGREPYMHLSSPKAGWSAGDPKPHHDYIDPADFPVEWLGKRFTLDVEAKAKERAIVALMRDLPRAPHLGRQVLPR
jgi:UV DNA damage endonuclease